MTSLEEYRKNRDERAKKLFEKAEQTVKGTTTSLADERFWEATVDKSGNGYAVVRFLDAKEGEDFPWVRLWYHYFQGPSGRWYIENSRKTLGKEEADPVSELNNRLWDSGIEENIASARDQKRKTKYISNILVVKDPLNPENEGKVFLYSYGKTIYDKINSLMNPENEVEDSQNPFDLETGRNFRIRIKTVDTGDRSYKNYTDSDWDIPGPVAKTPKEIEKIWSQAYSLMEFIDPVKSFKSYADLKKKLDEVLGTGGDNFVAPAAKTNGAKKVAVEPTKAETTTLKNDDDIDEDELLERLSSLAND